MLMIVIGGADLTAPAHRLGLLGHSAASDAACLLLGLTGMCMTRDGDTARWFLLIAAIAGAFVYTTV